MKKVGIMTFHAAYNFGSALQAYATQAVVDHLGYANEIINYRLKNQATYYGSLYTFKFGFKAGLRRCFRILEDRKRRRRAAKFENFIQNRLRLGAKRYKTYGALKDANLGYDILLSGSDQIWNKNCVAEFATEPEDSILAYFLGFQDHSARRVSYASSIGSMKEEQIRAYVPYLARYDALSVREADSARMLSVMLERPVRTALDPTLLLDANEWNLPELYRPAGRYVFLYTLGSAKKLRLWSDSIVRFAGRFGLKVICIAPLCKVTAPGIKEYVDAGPFDFLSYLKNAEVVLTDSYHGTAFSVNFGVPFYTMSKTADFRSRQLLENVRLQNRMVDAPADLDGIRDYACNFAQARHLLAKAREQSVGYLRDALAGADKTNERESDAV